MKKILLVEDDPYLIDVYVTKLEAGGFFVESAKDGESALKSIQKDKFDLILLDIILPKVGGKDVFNGIKKSKKNKDTKVIVLTNSEDASIKGLGADKCFIKINYTPNEILEEIRQLI